jgi:hypothetical protein
VSHRCWRARCIPRLDESQYLYHWMYYESTQARLPSSRCEKGCKSQMAFSVLTCLCLMCRKPAKLFRLHDAMML